jgi:hypothetical protein
VARDAGADARAAGARTNDRLQDLKSPPTNKKRNSPPRPNNSSLQKLRNKIKRKPQRTKNKRKQEKTENVDRAAAGIPSATCRITGTFRSAKPIWSRLF